ncbi:hypothetical protein Lalb_Chr01g0018281 [Lupinus albus]|uniref:Uncharacterized protein n=1 Tax=Lupinus albus TaxID=3870 RepID=A0A6A4R6Y0_LUPAL|nr:hypothetical protein Lalb_Chr01g0018281 [Lupinus albus]
MFFDRYDFFLNKWLGSSFTGYSFKGIIFLPSNFNVLILNYSSFQILFSKYPYFCKLCVLTLCILFYIFIIYFFFHLHHTSNVSYSSYSFIIHSLSLFLTIVHTKKRIERMDNHYLKFKFL